MEKNVFLGQHLIVSYSECNGSALHDLDGLASAMRGAVKASGATLLDSTEHVFANHGFTMLLLLAESHASIHTYPEHNACFVDIFTCGTLCCVEKFDETLQDYLRPQQTHRRILLRGKTTVDKEL